MREARRVQYLVLTISIVLFVVALAVFKYPKGDVNFYNSDAPYHVLLTMTAYDETPAEIHKFLPIVSLGSEGDKGIPWGGCVQDSRGNYYYTSFSPAGFVCPYLFVKLCRLPITIESLYIYNTALLAMSAILFMLLLKRIYGEEKYAIAIIGIGTLLYVTTPEIMHSMGIAYWAHSVMQVTLLAQVLAYQRKNSSKASAFIFYFLCVLNPYIEWTGFVANVGFTVAEASARQNQNKHKKSLRSALSIAALTGASGLLYIGHFLLVLDKKSFFTALYLRFFARNYSVKASWLYLLSGYEVSLGYLLLLVPVLLVLATFAYKGIGWTAKGCLQDNKKTLFLLLFPCLENVVMKQHAMQYSFDRMKLVFPLILILCDLILVIVKAYRGRTFKVLLVTALAISSVISVLGYRQNSHFVGAADYRADNRLLAGYLTETYGDSVMGTNDVPVRGYINLLFGRGIFEHTSRDEIIEAAKKQDKRFAIVLSFKEEEWAMDRLQSAEVIDLLTGDECLVELHFPNTIGLKKS